MLIKQGQRCVVWKTQERREIDYKASFQAWGQDYEEFESGPGNYSVAIVVDGNGNTHTPWVRLVSF